MATNPTKRPGALNYTTEVPPSRTIGEMQDLLARAGASHIGTQYRDRKPVGLSFTLETEFGERTFALPVDVKAAHRILKQEDERFGWSRKARKAAGYYSTPEQAERTAWRVMKDWLEAQLALIEYQMVQLDEIMLPYMVTDNGATVFQNYQDQQRAITAGGK